MGQHSKSGDIGQFYYYNARLLKGLTGFWSAKHKPLGGFPIVDKYKSVVWELTIVEVILNVFNIY